MPALDRSEKIALLVLVALAAVFIHDWDGFVFERAVRDLYHGITPYETGSEAPWYSLLGPSDHDPQWYAYPPLPLLMMAATFWPAELLHLPEAVQRVLLKAPMIVAHIALARVAGWWGARIDAGPMVRRLTLWNPFLILVGPIWGMTDPMMMAFLLGALACWVQRRPGWAGVLFGAALLVKPFPALLAIPLLAWVLKRHSWRAGVPVVAAAATTWIAVSLPFILHTPLGFWRQIGGAHLGRAAQGVSIWNWPLFDGVSEGTIVVLSMIALAAGLAAASIWSARRDGPLAPLEVVAAGALAILITNRVVNEQYVVMFVAPLLVLAAAAPVAQQTLRRLTHLMTATVALVGFHFLTFVPPDIALPLFGRPVDEVAHVLRSWAPGFWRALAWFFLFAVPIALVASLRALEPPRMRWTPKALPSIGLCALLVAGGAVSAGDEEPQQPTFEPAFEDPAVAAYYYLWWNNPAHDPTIQYGNWLVVSQSPEIGYYTNNRGVAALHAQQMVDNGIDTAIISYHRGELPRYEVFQEEAAGAGLWVTPLVELNQVYDKVVDGQRVHRPIDEDGNEAEYAAYRLSAGVKDEIIHFVLDLEDRLQQPNSLRIEGRPVVMFYDAYVSGVSFHGEDRDRLAQAVLDVYGIDALREHYNDPGLQDDYRDLLRYHPNTYEEFFAGPHGAPWRGGHLELHRQFWQDIQREVEEVTGPLYWISGESYNEQAGFEAGTVQSLVDLDLFDGQFIYSPSFTWGTNLDSSYEENFVRWADRNHWMQAYAQGAQRSAVVGIAPAYDDTVNRPDIGFVIPPTTPDGETYARSWEAMFRHPPELVAIATWNEYFEGSSLEPSQEFGDEWLLATSAYRESFEAARAMLDDRPALGVLTSEAQSRLSLMGTEMDPAHHWSMDLIAAAAFAYPDHQLFAVDADEADIDVARPRLLLVEGARERFDLSAAALRLTDDAVLRVHFGPEVVGGLDDALPASCTDGLDVLADAVLRPGDVLQRDGQGLWLERAGQTHHVARPCGDAAYVAFKPYGAGLSRTDAECVRVAVAAVLPSFDPAAPMACQG